MKNVSKSVSIYMALIILFNINFRSVCVGGDENNQSSEHGATQESCDKEKAVLNQKKEDVSEREQETKNSEIKDTTVPREQMTAESNHMQRFTHYRSDYWFIDRCDSLYEKDYFDNYYFFDEGDIDKSLECCNCCTIL